MCFWYKCILGYAWICLAMVWYVGIRWGMLWYVGYIGIFWDMLGYVWVFQVCWSTLEYVSLCFFWFLSILGYVWVYWQKLVFLVWISGARLGYVGVHRDMSGYIVVFLNMF